jgi:hypothetical protein
MKTDLRNRIVLPVVLPLLVILGIAAAVAGMAMIFLFTNRVLALTMAVVIATGIMMAISLANSVDAEDMNLARRGVILLTALGPIAIGAGVAIWSANGGLPEEDLNINKEPALAAPEGALVGAKNDQSFCAFSDVENQTADTCDDVSELTFPAQPEGSFLFLFHNVNDGVQHNFQIFQLAGDAEAPAPGDGLFLVPDGATVITGPAEILYNVPPETPLTPGQYYYNCVVHPVMQGVLTIAEGGDGTEAGA